MKIDKELFMAAAMALAMPASPLALTGCASTASSREDSTTPGPAEERDCSVEDCSDLY